RELVEGRFKDRVFIVSKCGPRVEKKTREWLAHHHFFERTGILREHVRFCRMRHHKAPLCHELGITHFVDDRLEVLGFMTTVPHRFLFRGRPHEVARFAEHLPNVLQVRTWQEIRERLL
ncbi:MAG: hypothetical protein HYT27_03075, partial [Parcubacteria group bacterium]|nr:hypothetical protein [Parcubacteria group bacterium]